MELTTGTGETRCSNASPWQRKRQEPNIAVTAVSDISFQVVRAVYPQPLFFSGDDQVIFWLPRGSQKAGRPRRILCPVFLPQKN